MQHALAWSSAQMVETTAANENTKSLIQDFMSE
jgi:hypothetical protein